MTESVLTSAQDSITAEAVEHSATSVVPEGSILIVARSGILVRKVPIARAGRALAFNQDIKAIQVTSERVENEFVYWFLRGMEPEILSRGVKKGATVHSLQSGFLERLEIPLPPLEEQRRIVGLLSHAAGIVRMRRESELMAKEIVPALFFDMFGDPSTNPMGWELGELGDVIREFRYGSSQKASQTGDPVLRIPNILAGRIDTRDLKYLAVHERDRQRYALAAGDILFVRTNGNPDYVGRCAVFTPPDARTWLYASYLIRGRPDAEVVSVDFLQAYLASSEGRRHLRSRARTAAGQYNINTDGLRSIPIILPPMDVQRSFVKKSILACNLQGRSSIASHMAEGSFLSLLAQVFRELA